MSIQFRSRIKNIADYGSILTDTGACCKPGGTAVELTYGECLKINGYFQYFQTGEDIGSILCPELGSVGCCCACSYVDDFDEYLHTENGYSNYNGGLEDNVTLCECNAKGGVWGGADKSCSDYSDITDIFNLCTNGTNNVEYDSRFPAGCCVNSGDGTYDCKNVCSEKECSDAQSSGLTGSYFPDNACGDNFHEFEADCSVGEYYSNQIHGGLGVEGKYNNTLRVTNLKTFDEEYINTINQKDGLVSACIQNKNKGEYKCEMSSLINCDGFWMGLRPNGDNYNCDDSNEINIVKNFIQNKTIKRSDIINLNIGDWLIAGRYLGVYHSVDSPYEYTEVIGNIETGPAQETIILGKSKDSVEKQLKSYSKHEYAIIVADNDFKNESVIFSNQLSTPKTSVCNSEFNMKNTSFKLINDIKNDFIVNGIGSYFWSLPSIRVLSFMFKQTSNPEFLQNAILNNNKPESHYRQMKGKYWSSTLLNDTGGTPLVYTQTFNNNSFVSSSTMDMIAFARPIIVAKIE
jgi:hypothetical protein